MRRLGGAWVWVGVVAASIGLALYGRAAARDVRQLEVREVPSGAATGPGGEPIPETRSLSVEGSRTLPMADVANEADGLLELRVTAGDRSVPRAQVRLYRREGRLPGTGKVDWRIAAGGATGNDGRLLMPVRPGAYLLVARAEGLAPAWLNLVHPFGGPRTLVNLQLEEPTSFFGRTVLQGTGRPLPGVELTLSPDVSIWEQEVGADAPAEERVTVTSDASGQFRVEELAPGGYTVEGRAPGSSVPVEWTLWLPSTESRVLALPGTGSPKRIPQRAPSSELRCGY
ncbi:MAG TPA: carboxypeptidase-like regulatory domain-containing protein [Hyalangium sp.]|nr:carboxypeptidase-like regulatory domain-containing protein [Hyalangium sp.]